MAQAALEPWTPLAHPRPTQHTQHASLLTTACLTTGQVSGEPNVAWLWSYPGSGSTWTRLLIEAASGFGAGSLYHDNSLDPVLAEAQDVRNITSGLGGLIVVKTHTLGPLYLDADQRGRLPSWRNISRAVVIVRDPYDALLSYYKVQRAMAETGYAVDATADPHTAEHEPGPDFPGRALGAMGAVFIRDILTEQLLFRDANPAGSFLLRFEELRDPAVRIERIRALLQFCSVNATNERLACAFDQSDAEHRHASATSTRDAFCSEAAKAVNLVESVWAIVSEPARRLGYSMLDCNS